MFLEELSFGTILDCSALIRPSSSHSQAGADLCSKDTCLVWSLRPGRRYDVQLKCLRYQSLVQ